MSLVLVTGGSGFIGSHTTLALLEAGFEVLVVDNLSNSSPESLRRVAELAGRHPIFVEGDVRDQDLLSRLLTTYPVKAVFHFAGLKSVGDSLRSPLEYYENNVLGSLSLCRAMADADVFTLVFSSSATVYGSPVCLPIAEDVPTGVLTNPYGRSKLMVEQVLNDVAVADARWKIAILRYFNPVGAHRSGRIGEDPNGIPNNLLPYVAQVAAGRIREVNVYGNDYPTPDGTGIRDYVHVVDLAAGHLRALHALQSRSGVHIWNLGAGKGYSVLAMIRAFEVVSGRRVPFRFVARRPGDVVECWADCRKAEAELEWRAELELHDIVRDAWHWQCLNPGGYKK